MVDLLWPGDELAGDVLTDAWFLEEMVLVEREWLGAMVSCGLGPDDADDDLSGLCTSADIERIGWAAGSSGNPAGPLVELLRERVRGRNPAAAAWLHRGLTSQDVIDTALVLGLRATVDRVEEEICQQVSTLVDLADGHRRSYGVARTLTQHAVPTSFGLTSATWTTGIVEAGRLLRAAGLGLTVQAGGAAGTLAASTHIAAERGLPDPPRAAQLVVAEFADRLGLKASAPWHTTRGRLTSVVDALVTCTDAWGHMGSDVATLSRPELGELSEGIGGSSSTMPQKHNPVLSVLLRRTASANPPLAATLHVAAGAAVDQRPDGAWHTEWATVRTVARRSITAAVHASSLLAGLQVDTAAMVARLNDAAGEALAERQVMSGLVDGRSRDAYVGALDAFIDAAISDGRSFLEGPQ